MTDAERASFANLILLCTPHHKLIDRISPDDYSVDLLKSWKTYNEPADGLQVLRNVTETDFEDLLEQFAGTFIPQRLVEIDLLAGFLISSEDIATVSPDAFDMLLRTNPNLAPLPQVMVSNIRNTGALPVGVEAVELHFGIPVTHGSSEGEASLTLMGRNDFGLSNPALPYRLKDGDAVRWLTKMETVRETVKTAASSGSRVRSLWVRVRLATGETVDSIKVPWPFIDSWTPSAESTVTSTAASETSVGKTETSA